MKKLSTGIVILNYKTSNLIQIQIRDLLSFDSIDWIVIVDSFTNYGERERISQFESDYVHVILLDDNRGYAQGNNIGLKFLVEERMVDIAYIMNPDVRVQDSYFRKINNQFEKVMGNSRIALISGLIKDENNRYVPVQYWKLPGKKEQFLDCFFPFRRLQLYHTKQLFKKDIANKYDFKIVDVIPGSLFAIRSSILREINYLDNSTFLFYEENLLAAKLKMFGYHEAIDFSVCYNHLHIKSSTGSFLSSIQRYKYWVSSRKSFQKKYLHFSKLELVPLKIFEIYGWVESFLIGIAKRGKKIILLCSREG